MYKRDAPKLNKSSFCTWQKRMKLHLSGIGKYIVYYLENNFITPRTYPLTMEEIKAKKEHIQAMIEITSALTDLEFNDLEGCNDAKVMWDKLISVYGGDEHVQREKVDSLRGQLEYMRMNEGGTIEEKDFTSKLLRTLLPAYAIRVFAINELRSIPNMPVSLDATIGKLHTFELSKFDNNGSSVTKVETAFSSFHLDEFDDYNDRKYKYSEGNHNGASERFCKNMEEVHKLYEEIRNQEEFEALLARRLPRGKADEESNDDKLDEIDTKEVVYVDIKDGSDEERYEEKDLISRINTNDSWIIDSGCSHHMIGDKHKFVILEDYDGGYVRFGNDAPYPVRGKGSITLLDIAKCNDVYWVEGLKYNLLSVAQLNNTGYRIEF
ncbi:hypothetical protein SUGI_0060740 [Cryptomeria japonica]|nr:hypothetical protein SUGI_0060740 [Cryptomeria japonica]